MGSVFLSPRNVWSRMRGSFPCFDSVVFLSMFRGLVLWVETAGEGVSIHVSHGRARASHLIHPPVNALSGGCSVLGLVCRYRYQCPLSVVDPRTYFAALTFTTLLPLCSEACPLLLVPGPDPGPDPALAVVCR